MATATLSQKEQDIQMMLAAGCHLGTKQLDFQMERYVFKRRADGELRGERGSNPALRARRASVDRPGGDGSDIDVLGVRGSKRRGSGEPGGVPVGSVAAKDARLRVEAHVGEWRAWLCADRAGAADGRGL